jgi:predicted amidohydrolase
MPALARYYAATCQTDLPCLKHRSELAGRVNYLLGMVDRAVVGYGPFFDVKLLVFPEFAHTAPIYETIEELDLKLAVTIPNDHTDRYARKARERGVWIQTGTLHERDERWPGSVFNTTCLIGPDGLLSRYRKVNPWLPWELHTSPADLKGYDQPFFPVVETEIGRLGAAICYDWLFPEAIRALALGGAEVLCRVSAYMDPWGATPPMDWWTLINRARAVENFAYVVAANQGASAANYPPFSWPGASMIVDYDGRILAQADPGPGERITVGPIDLAHSALSAPGAAGMRCFLTSERAPILASMRGKPKSRAVTALLLFHSSFRHGSPAQDFISLSMFSGGWKCAIPIAPAQFLRPCWPHVRSTLAIDRAPNSRRTRPPRSAYPIKPPRHRTRFRAKGSTT